MIEGKNTTVEVASCTVHRTMHSEPATRLQRDRVERTQHFVLYCSLFAIQYEVLTTERRCCSATVCISRTTERRCCSASIRFRRQVDNEGTPTSFPKSNPNPLPSRRVMGEGSRPRNSVTFYEVTSYEVTMSVLRSYFLQSHFLRSHSILYFSNIQIMTSSYSKRRTSQTNQCSNLFTGLLLSAQINPKYHTLSLANSDTLRNNIIRYS